MSKFELISVDMFQTLVDVNSRIKNIWQRILGSDYSEESAKKYATVLYKIVYERFHKDVSELDDFLSLKLIFQRYFSEVFHRNKLHFNPEEAAKIFAEEHNNAVLYEDTNYFFQVIGHSIPICLVSDSDHDMISSHIDNFRFDRIFISEQVKSYKNQANGKIFEEVIRHYGISPEKILHIGDASSDIIGASRSGITTCWLNRNGQTWNNDIHPTYTIKTLTSIEHILEV